jgi:hypothetical protein
MWHSNPRERWSITKVLEYLEQPNMWDESTTEDFNDYLEWYNAQRMAKVELGRVWKASEGRAPEVHLK